MSSANYQINSTLGQPSPLPDSDSPPISANYQLFPGIWYTISHTSSQQIREVGEEYAYATIQEATTALVEKQDTFFQWPVLEKVGRLAAYLIVDADCTDLTNTAEASFLNTGKFDTDAAASAAR